MSDTIIRLIFEYEPGWVYSKLMYEKSPDLCNWYMNVLSAGKNNNLFLRCVAYNRLDFLKILANSNKECWIDAFLHACSIDYYECVKWFLDDAHIDRKILSDRKEEIQKYVFGRGSVKLIELLDKELKFDVSANEYWENPIITIAVTNNVNTARWIAARTGTPRLCQSSCFKCVFMFLVIIILIELIIAIILSEIRGDTPVN